MMHCGGGIQGSESAECNKVGRTMAMFKAWNDLSVSFHGAALLSSRIQLVIVISSKTTSSEVEGCSNFLPLSQGLECE